jgi:hypothetical protein
MDQGVLTEPFNEACKRELATSHEAMFRDDPMQVSPHTSERPLLTRDSDQRVVTIPHEGIGLMALSQPLKALGLEADSTFAGIHVEAPRPWRAGARPTRPTVPRVDQDIDRNRQG